MLAFIQDNQIEKFPISLGDLKERFPNTSFTLPLNAEDLSGFGVVEVESLPVPDHDSATQRAKQKDPEYLDGRWVSGFNVVNIPQKELDAAAEEKRVEAENSVINERNNLLRESDWTQLPTGPLTQEQKDSWETYRQALRDISIQEGYPFDVTWPTVN